MTQLKRRKSDMKQGASAAQKPWPTVARQKEKRAALLEKAHRGVALFDAQENMIDCNDVFSEMLDLPLRMARGNISFGDVLSHQVDHGLFPGSDPDHFVARRMNTVRKATLDTHIENMPDGRVFSVGHIPVESGGFVLTIDDMSSIFAIKDELEHAGFYDRRTSLPNKRVLLKCIDEAYATSWDEEYFALLTLRVMNHDVIVRSLGDESGHELNRQIAERIKNTIRKEDLPAKLDGPVFAVLEQSVTAPDNAEALATRLLRLLSMPYEVYGKPVMAEIVCGIALPNEVDDRETVLLENALEAITVAASVEGHKFAYYTQDEVALSA